ncbi:MAG: dihydroxyacetone kinase subunit L [Planctomycetes bacterium]|nr:dihydroxyacetone kinase subunit L [Planctomycetota bacterium]
MDKNQLVSMFHKAASNIESSHVVLSELDAATGDGDHGVTIHRTMQAAIEATDENAEKPMAEFLKAIAFKVMSCDGGSTSPLLGSYFLGMSMSASGDEMTPSETAAFFEGALENMLKTSKAALGDKTMMDALIPATETLASNLKDGTEFTLAFGAAAESAAQGAEKTKEYVAKFGRARTMGERAIGHIDPGAVSISHIFRGFAEAWTQN